MPYLLSPRMGQPMLAMWARIWWVRAGTALFIGGAVGNLIDRAENGMVVDFFDFRIWPIFNVADIAICVGVGFIIWNLIQTEILKK